MITFLLALLLAGPALQTTIPPKVSGSFKLTATATDPPTPVPGSTNTVPGCGIARVEWRVNGKIIGTATVPAAILSTAPSGAVLSGSYEFTWDTTTLADGTYDMDVRGFDRSGGPAAVNGTECDGKVPNVTDPVTGRVEIDNVPVDTTKPTIQITAPKMGATVSGRPNVEVQAKDDQGVRVMTLDIVDGRGRRESYQQEGTQLESLVYRWNTNPYKGQTVNIRATASDSAGNSNNETITVNVRR